MNSKVSALFLFNWIQFTYDFTDSIFLIIHIPTFRHTFIIFYFNIFTFLRQFLLWSHTLCCWKINIIKLVSKALLFILLQLFLIVRTNNTTHDHMLRYYCYRHNDFTICALYVISLILRWLFQPLCGKQGKCSFFIQINIIF